MHVRSFIPGGLGFPLLLALLVAAPIACGSESPTTPAPSGSTSGGDGGAGGAVSSSSSSSGSSTSGGGGAGGNEVMPPTPCDPAKAMCPCSLQGECGQGTVCAGGICIAPCDFDYQCSDGKVCANGSCTPACGPNDTCPDAGYKCSKGVCVPDPQNPECGAASPCPPGEACASGICSTACDENTDCMAGQACEWATGACINFPSIKKVCMDSSQCMAASPQMCGGDGFCHYVCDPNGANGGVTQCKQIDNRFDYCDGGICKTLAEKSPQCTTQKPCPLGKDCISNKCL